MTRASFKGENNAVHGTHSRAAAPLHYFSPCTINARLRASLPRRRRRAPHIRFAGGVAAAAADRNPSQDDNAGGGWQKEGQTVAPLCIHR